MGRLFWTFPDGLPGAGLLLLRFALATGLIIGCLSEWPIARGLPMALCVAEGLAAVLLAVGLGTPVWGAGAAVVELYRAYSTPAELPVHLLFATLGFALALIGPGAYSMDACMFGWRRIEFPDARDGSASARKLRGPASKGSRDHSN